MKFRKYIITCECFNAFCPTPAPLDGFDDLETANEMFDDIAFDLQSKGRFSGKALTIYNTQSWKYERIIEL